MTVLKEYLSKSGKTMSDIAREIGVRVQDVSHVARREGAKVGRARRKKIRDWMVGEGLLKPRRKPEYWTCPLCKARHVKRKNAPPQVVELMPEGANQR
jgi:hypothetical protein